MATFGDNKLVPKNPAYMEESSEESELLNLLEFKDYSKIIEYLNTNNNTPIWDYSIEDCKTFLHIISETQIYNYVNENENDEKATIEAKKFSDFLMFILEYLGNHLSHDKYTEYINRGTIQGNTALHYAAYYGNIYSVIILINKGADYRKKNNAGMNMMHSAAQGNQTTILAYLNEFYKFDINERDEENSTPLHWACFMGSISASNFLILSGADVNALDKKNNSPLHMATDGAKIKIFRILLYNGANPRIKNVSNKTPLQLAIEKKNNLKIRTMLHKSINGQSLCDCHAPLVKVKRSNLNKILFFVFHFFLLISTALVVFPFVSTGVKMISFHLLLLVMIIFIILLFVNPWKQEVITQRISFYKDNYNLEKILEGSKIINIDDYCPICLIRTRNQPITHCYICNKCSVDFDHHCYWINKDISKKNFNLFMILLFSGLIYSGVSFFITIISFISMMKEANEGKINKKQCKKDIYSTKMCGLKWLFNGEFYVFFIIDNIVMCLCLIIYFIFIGILTFIHFKDFIKQCFTKKEKEKGKDTIKENLLLPPKEGEAPAPAVFTPLISDEDSSKA
ncbi:MAG: ankyrin repeat domain-containing protein [archaeon]|nr:ankyrin repeat domain-containing protein [archaeon]